MSQATGNGSRRTVGRVLGGASAVLLFAAAIVDPKVANAHDGGGGFHGGVEGFTAAGSISAPCSGLEASSHRFWWNFGYPFFPFYDNGYYGNYPDHRNYGYDPGSSYYGNYPDSGYGSQPNTNARQTWYYCSHPAGYYPSVKHCNTVWQYGPGSARNRDRATSRHGSRD